MLLMARGRRRPHPHELSRLLRVQLATPTKARSWVGSPRAQVGRAGQAGLYRRLFAEPRPSSWLQGQAQLRLRRSDTTVWGASCGLRGAGGWPGVTAGLVHPGAPHGTGH